MTKYLAQVEETIVAPDFIDYNHLGLGSILGWVMRLVFVAAGLLVFYQLIFGALEWIQSGGDKEKLEKARKKITSAVLGFIILFVVLGAIVLIENVFGFGLGFTEPIVIPKFGYSN